MANQITTPTKSFERKSKSNHSLDNVVQELSENIDKVERKISASLVPIDVLPDQIKTLVEELSIKYKFPKDFCLVFILWVVSVAAGNNFRLEVKRNWHEPAILYVALVAMAGQTKTPVESFFTAVLKDINRKYYEQWAKDVEGWEERKRLASKESPFNEKKPVRKQVIIQDSTIEALTTALSNNIRGLGILFDELAGFFGNQNRYNNGNESHFYLSTFTCQPYSSNRKTTQDIYLRSPYLSIIGGIQPQILCKTFTDEMQDNGTLSRFLLCYPEGLKKEIANDEEIDQSLIDFYNDSIKFLMQRSDFELDRLQKHEKDIFYILIPLEDAAKKKLLEYLQINADAVNQYNDEGEFRLASTMSKFDYHVIRLSFIIQLLQDACQRELTTIVTQESVIKGIRLADYFKWQAKRVHSLISGDPLAALDQNKRDFFNALPNSEFALAEAVEIAKETRAEDLEQGIIKADAVEKWAKRFLATRLFTKPKHGIYLKK